MKSYGQDVSTAILNESLFDIASQESIPNGIAFNTDGTKMFIVGALNSSVVEYTLGTSFDVSTAVYGGLNQEFSVKAQESVPNGIVFNNDGSKMFIVGSSDNSVVEYVLDVAFDVSTAVYLGIETEFSVSDQETIPFGIAFNTDGTKMFIVGLSRDSVIEYALGTAFTVSTAVYSGIGEEFYIGGQELAPRELLFNADGTKMFVIGTTDDRVVEYVLDVAFDVSTAAYTGASEEYDLNDQEPNPKALFFNTDGSKMFIVGNSQKTVFEYTIAPSSNIAQVRFVEGTTGTAADTQVTTNNYSTGDDIIIRVEYDGPVAVAGGSPYIALPSLNKNTTYVFTSGQSLFFSHTLVDGDETTNLTAAPIISLNQATSTIKDDQAIDASLDIRSLVVPKDKALSIEDNEFNSSIRMYPNPVTSELNIRLKTGDKLKSVQISNVLGEAILTTRNNEINISSLPAGIYFLKLENTEGKAGVRKIIKE